LPVRPYPVARNVSPATGAVPNATGVMPVAGVASRASTTSSVGCGSNSATAAVTPPALRDRSSRPTVTVVATGGVPAAAGAGSKQDFRVSTYSACTSAPEHPRSPAATRAANG
jgi:hypothetical protein